MAVLLRRVVLCFLVRVAVGGGDEDSAQSPLEDNNALFTTILILSFLMAIQLILCVAFGYKGCLAKFKPPPPPYSPPVHPLNPTIVGGDEPPPVYSEREDSQSVGMSGTSSQGGHPRQWETSSQGEYSSQGEASSQDEASGQGGSSNQENGINSSQEEISCEVAPTATGNIEVAETPDIHHEIDRDIVITNNASAAIGTIEEEESCEILSRREEPFVEERREETVIAINEAPIDLEGGSNSESCDNSKRVTIMEQVAHGSIVTVNNDASVVADIENPSALGNLINRIEVIR